MALASRSVTSAAERAPRAPGGEVVPQTPAPHLSEDALRAEGERVLRESAEQTDRTWGRWQRGVPVSPYSSRLLGPADE